MSLISAAVHWLLQLLSRALPQRVWAYGSCLVELRTLLDKSNFDRTALVYPALLSDAAGCRGIPKSMHCRVDRPLFARLASRPTPIHVWSSMRPGGRGGEGVALQHRSCVSAFQSFTPEPTTAPKLGVQRRHGALSPPGAPRPGENASASSSDPTEWSMSDAFTHATSAERERQMPTSPCRLSVLIICSPGRSAPGFAPWIVTNIPAGRAGPPGHRWFELPLSWSRHLPPGTQEGSNYLRRYQVTESRGHLERDECLVALSASTRRDSTQAPPLGSSTPSRLLIPRADRTAGDGARETSSFRSGRPPKVTECAGRTPGRIERCPTSSFVMSWSPSTRVLIGARNRRDFRG